MSGSVRGRRQLWASLPELDDGLRRVVRVAQLSRRSLKAMLRNCIADVLRRQDPAPVDVCVRSQVPYQEPRLCGFDEDFHEAQRLVLAAEKIFVGSLSELANQLASEGRLDGRGRLERGRRSTRGRRGDHT